MLKPPISAISRSRSPGRRTSNGEITNLDGFSYEILVSDLLAVAMNIKPEVCQTAENEDNAMSGGSKEICLGAADDGINDTIEDGEGARNTEEEAVIAALFNFERLMKIFEAVRNSGGRDEDTVYTDAEIGVKNQEATID